MDNNKFYRAITRRRVSCPLIAQQLWDAIKAIRYQRQQSTFERVSRYMVRVYGMAEEEVRRQLVHCVRDGLIKQFKRIGFKGKMTGVEQEKYLIPLQLDPPHDGHDWYCFECHNSGDVICCTGCHRVYHLACLPPDDLMTDDVKNTFTCPTCKACETEESWIARKQLNRLLIHTCTRLKERLPLSLTDRQVPSKYSYASGDRSSGRDGFVWVIDEEQQWRVDFLLYRTVDIHAMEKKANLCQYRTLAEFEADAATIVHNVVIYHGAESVLADMTSQMLRDCLYDLAELRLCSDCYRRSNELVNDKHWFCLPCNPPHMLVYAKQKGYPFWPAKVIKIEGDMYDVRFFGGPHERAKLEKSFIRDISVNLSSLGVKRSAAWNRAWEELRHHQQLLANGPRPESPYPSSNEEEKIHLDLESQAKVETEEDRGHSTPVKEPEDELEKVAGETLKKPTPKRGAKRQKSTINYTDTEETNSTSPKRRARKSGASRASTPGSQRRRKRPSAVPNEELANTVEVEVANENERSADEDSVVSTCLQPMPTKEEEDQVSSSCTVPRARNVAVQTPPRLIRGDASQSRHQSRERESQLQELRREYEREKLAALAAKARQHERELEALQAEHVQELARIKEHHRIALAESKRKQWCYNCEAEAIYHCCWNTAYCSTECQQSHWHKEHKRLCRRKR